MDPELRRCLRQQVSRDRANGLDFPGWGSRGEMERNWCYMRAIPSLVQHNCNFFSAYVLRAVKCFDDGVEKKHYGSSRTPRKQNMMNDIDVVMTTPAGFVTDAMTCSRTC